MQKKWLLLPKIKPAFSLLRTSTYSFVAVQDHGGSIFILAGMFSASLVKKWIIVSCCGVEKYKAVPSL